LTTRHGDKNIPSEFAVLQTALPPSEAEFLKTRTHFLGLVGLESYMDMAQKIRQAGVNTEYIYLESDDEGLWQNVHFYPEWKFLRFKAPNSGLHYTFMGMLLLSGMAYRIIVFHLFFDSFLLPTEGDYFIGTFTSNYGRFGYEIGLLFNKMIAGVSLDTNWWSI